ncbi:hypothetical protein EJB05_44890 [Eragrostis curvula]|uniref:F-box domain-containing protein n=1 Tax=Eragrostis curvula TaxID=38414 RepID=A0A5J9TJ23_9POAL|nr:hypothetical protein EJB05_44890 [Eragrostis curvula]
MAPQNPRRSAGSRPATTELQPIDGMDVSMSEMEADLRQSTGLDHPDLMGAGMAMFLVYMYASIPNPPVSPAAPLASAVAARPPADGVDRISRLPDQILRNVVSRLPAKDAARTGALAARWRGLWLSVPLSVVDEQILPRHALTERMAPGGDTIWSRLAVAAASSALEAHPGPFRCAHLTRGHMASHEAEAKCWLQLLAAKGVQELVFINHPYPINSPLPAEIFSCVSVTKLHLGLWMLPSTAALPRSTRFPHLRELVLGFILMRDRDLAFLIERSPVLESLTMIARPTMLSLRLVSRSLRCVQVGMCGVDNITVVDAPCLERLFLWMSVPEKRSRIKIGHAPKLRMLGYWQPADHELEVGSTVIKESTKVSLSTVVPSVQILALEVQFDVRNDVKMVPTFLKRFPNVETLHIYSQGAGESKLDLKFWLDAGPIECVQSHVKKFVFQEFRGKRSELVFLKFIAERAQFLQKMIVMVSSSVHDVNAKLKPLTSAKWASEGCKLIVFKSSVPSNRGAPLWVFSMASDSSCRDPFGLETADGELNRDAYVLDHSSTL